MESQRPRTLSSRSGAEQHRTRRATRLTMRRLLQRISELHAREFEGETTVTPLLMVAGLLLLIVPVLVVILGAAFAAYYLG